MLRHLPTIVALTAMLALRVAVAADPQPVLRLLRTIPLPGVKGRIDHFALDPDGKHAVVACLENDTVARLDLEAGKVAGTVTGLAKPQGVVLLPSSGRIVVANGEDRTVRWLDGKTLSLVRKVELEGDADNVRFDEAAGLLYVGFGDGALAVVDKEIRKKDIPLAGHPESFQLETKGNRIFVNVPDAIHIAVVDRTSGRVTATWPTGDARENYPMALDEAAHRLYVGCRSPASLLVLDTANGAILSKPVISGDVDDVWVDASGKRIYCACGEGFLDVLERAAGDAWTRIAKVETAAGARTALYDPKSGMLLVAVPAKALPTAEVRIYATR